MDTSKPLRFDENGVVQIGPMRIGMVDPKSINNRRENPRAMSEVEYQALRKSIDRMGFKSFVLAEEIKPGKYGIVDGHHRVRALKEGGAPKIPIILVDAGTSKDDVDLAMLTFNVTGSANGDVYMDFLKELTDRMGAEVVAESVGLNKDFLADMFSTIKEVEETMAKAGESTEPSHHTGGEFHGRGLRVEFPTDTETQELLRKVHELAGTDTLVEAITAAMREYVDKRTVLEDASEPEASDGQSDPT